MESDIQAERTVNAQYNLAAPDSLSVRVAARVRRAMFGSFMRAFAPRRSDTVLDVGVTSDQTYLSSNYLEALYPHKDRITAAGLDDAGFLEELYPGLAFVRADALDLPFGDGQFDLVHSSAVLEHVGCFENQRRMIEECMRVARRGVCVTTPNRWFPIEFHTQVPLLHWLPKRACRALFRRMGLGFFAEEANLNLMTARELRRIMNGMPGCRWTFAPTRLLGWTSNLVLIIHKDR